jgi:predicted nucleic acid-binding protein
VILYLDSSALVKFYLEERGSVEVREVYRDAEQAGTVLITKAEVSAGLAKAHRMGLVSEEDARKARSLFHKEWSGIIHVAVSEILTSRADDLAWPHGLRGYNAVHLAAALLWQESINLPISVATFDTNLWEAANNVGLQYWPESLVPFIGS